MLTHKYSFYSFFCKYSLVKEYGFLAGLFHRFFRKFIPRVAEKKTIEYFVLYQNNSIEEVTDNLNLESIEDSSVKKDLDLSIQSLVQKIGAIGLDSKIIEKFEYLNLDYSALKYISKNYFQLSFSDESDFINFKQNIDEVEKSINELRKNKNKIGTNFHLTLLTRRILDYTQRIKELLDLKENITSKQGWISILEDFIIYSKSKNSIRKYIKRHSDLVALQIVEHTSDKGEKYIAETNKEYWSFFYKSLLGGGIIAVFAFLKLILSTYHLPEVTKAFVYSINYALCFVLVKQFGGIIATKQPAMTASTIADNIDKNHKLQIDSFDEIKLLIRKVFRSQFISIMGNFLMAIILASLIMFGLKLFNVSELMNVVNPKYLIKNVVPSVSLIFYASIAGFFLAISGLIAGYVDNKVINSKLPYRIKHLKFFNSDTLANFIKKKFGTLVGNISLGFFLGSTFLFSNFLPFDIDIRHIAFSSSFVGYAFVYEGILNIKLLCWAISGALLIGIVNFLVSFSITLYLALKSRSTSLTFIPRFILKIFLDFLKNPHLYFYKNKV